MRSTLEIIIAVKESKQVTEEELQMALLVMSALDFFTSSHLEDLVEAIEKGNQTIINIQLAEAKRWQHTKIDAQKKNALEYLGPENIPGNAAYEGRMRLFKKIAKAATGIDL